MNYNYNQYGYGGYPPPMGYQQGPYGPPVMTPPGMGAPPPPGMNPAFAPPPYGAPQPSPNGRPNPAIMQPPVNPMMGVVNNLRASQPMPYPGAVVQQHPNGSGSGPGISPYQGLPTSNSANVVSQQPPQPANLPPNRYPQVQNIVKFKIPKGKENSYANLYSLIVTVEELESQYCDGNLNSEDHNRLLKQLTDQFVTVQNALNLSPDDVTCFVNSIGMQASYAMTALFRPTASVIPSDDGSKSSHVKEAMDLGSDFTTLLDCCYMGNVPAGDFVEYIRKIRSRLQVMNVYQRNQQVREYTDKWLSTFNKFRATDSVPQDVIDELKNDIQPWRHTSIDAYQ